MARKPRLEKMPAPYDEAKEPQLPVEPEAEQPGELVVGKITAKTSTPGTMSSKAFTTLTLETSDGEVSLESSGRLAGYIALLNVGERVAVFVENGWIVGVA